MLLKEYIIEILPGLSTASTFLPFIIALICINCLKTEVKWLFFLVLASILAELIGLIMHHYTKSGNIIYINIYQIVETILITLFFRSTTPTIILRYLITLLCTGICIWSLYFILGPNRNSLNDVAFGIESIYVMIFSLLGFYFLLKKLQNNNIWDIPVFWVNSALLLYFGGNLFLHGFGNYLYEHSLYTFFELWSIIHSSLNILFYILIAVAFWKTRKYQA